MLRTLESHRSLMWAAVVGWLIVLSIFALAFVQSTQARASGTPPTKPAYATSFYITSASTNPLSTDGCNQGHADASHGASSEVILDFGGQLQDGSGAKSVFSTVSLSNAQIQADALAFAKSYFQCVGTSNQTDYLGIGTNNSAYLVSTSGGQTWGKLVSSISSAVNSAGYGGSVIVRGANDAEPGFGSNTGTVQWAQGFQSAFTNGFYVDYGSADGCPQSDSSGTVKCNNGWTQYDEWDLSYGLAGAESTPEIYFDGQAPEWYEICLYGQYHQNLAVFFDGPLDEHAMPNNPGYTSTQAWNALAGLLVNSDCAQTMPYSLEIGKE